MPELLTISELVKRTGVPRTSIHFYLREGLLPRPQRAGANRAFYTEDHVRLLEQVKGLKNEGLPLADIRARIADELTMIENRDVGLIAQENERIRKTIVRVATEEFLSHGYDQARIADIIRRAGVNTKIFYNLFPSKAELLVESFKTFVSWNLAFTEPKLAEMEPGERLLWRVHANSEEVAVFGPSVLSLVWHEAAGRPELIGQVQEAWTPLIDTVAQEFQRALKPGVAAPVSLELLAYGLVGAHQHSSLRASWDDTHGPEDVLAAHLWLFMTVYDALKRQAEPDPYISRYAELIKEVAARGPESPPAPPE